MQKPNPVKSTPAVLAAAKKTWGFDCAMCHGADGDGKGDLAADMKLTLKDYRDPDALKNMTDGELFWIINKGKEQMSGEEGRAKPPEIWGLVDYVRSFSKKSATSATWTVDQCCCPVPSMIRLPASSRGEPRMMPGIPPPPSP